MANAVPASDRDLFGHAIDVEHVNIVSNSGMPDDRDSDLHRVGRAGRFGAKGLALERAIPSTKQSGMISPHGGKKEWAAWSVPAVAFIQSPMHSPGVQ